MINLFPIQPVTPSSVPKKGSYVQFLLFKGFNDDLLAVRLIFFTQKRFYTVKFSQKTCCTLILDFAKKREYDAITNYNIF